MSTQILLPNAPATAMRLRSGGLLDLANPNRCAISLADIAEGLARICRFGAQASRWYSVAEHCVHAAQHSLRRGHPLECSQAVLLHDAAEAYVGDVIRPLRNLVPSFVDVERRVLRAIFVRFDVKRFWLDNWRLREIDDGLLVAEYARLFGGEVAAQPEFAATEFEFWGHEEAARRFMVLAEELGIAD